jgi:hypothetical protein
VGDEVCVDLYIRYLYHTFAVTYTLAERPDVPVSCRLVYFHPNNVLSTASCLCKARYNQSAHRIRHVHSRRNALAEPVIENMINIRWNQNLWARLFVVAQMLLKGFSFTSR